eukprot:gene24763-30158_t
MAPVTMLDDPVYSKALGQFWGPFEDAYYYWQVNQFMVQMMLVVFKLTDGANAFK